MSDNFSTHLVTALEGIDPVTEDAPVFESQASDLRAIPFHEVPIKVGEDVTAGVENYFGSPKGQVSQAAGDKSKLVAAMGGCDSEYSTLTVLFRDNVYYIAGDVDLFTDNTGADFNIWMLQRTADDRLVFDINGVGWWGSDVGAWIFHWMAAVLGVIISSPATAVGRLSGQTQGLASYMALACDAIEVLPMGELIITPPAQFNAGESVKVYEPFATHELFGRALKKGIITSEEYDILVKEKQLVRITHAMLTERKNENIIIA